MHCGRLLFEEFWFCEVCAVTRLLSDPHTAADSLIHTELLYFVFHQWDENNLKKWKENCVPRNLFISCDTFRSRSVSVYE